MSTKTAMIPDVMVTNEGIQVELWRNRGQSEKFLARGDVHRLLPEEENRKEFCQSLGFLQQADGILPLDPKLIYHEMDEKEKRVWEAFLPTIYYDQNIHSMYSKRSTSPKKRGCFTRCRYGLPSALEVFIRILSSSESR